MKRYDIILMLISPSSVPVIADLVYKFKLRFEQVGPTDECTLAYRRRRRNESLHWIVEHVTSCQMHGCFTDSFYSPSFDP